MTSTDRQTPDSDGASVPPETNKKQKTDQKRRYECTFAGCGRTYSRAEHLYRHQLNHNPKEIFRCNQPGCSRTFVRQDLCLRHQERHTNRGKQESDADEVNLSALSPTRSSDKAEHNIPVVIESTNLRSNGSANSTPPTKSQNNVDPARDQGEQNDSGDDAWKGLIIPTGLDFADYDALSKTAQAQTTTRPTFQTPANPASRSVIRQEQNLMSPPATSSGQRMVTDSGSNPFGIPGYVEQAYTDSPVSVRDEFTNWLFEDFGAIPNAPFSMAAHGATGFPMAADSFGTQIFTNYFADPALNNSFPGIMQQRSSEFDAPPPDLSLNSNLLSPSKRMTLLSLLEFRFSEGDNSAIGNLKDDILQGDREADDHLLSMRSMQHYIGSYWYHFHAQLPILHQPTFSAESTHNYLLLAIMAIGASYLNRAHGRAITDGASRLATFIAWHLRWQVFMDRDFRPPAKLWVFQTLLLLEVYEKTNATRALHERSHIHYPTTIMLMRRGTALIDDGQAESSRQPSSPEQWWSRWITAEATRRAAFAAFFLDSLHATMFGHAAMMVVHEVRLPLPCDDALWSATSAAEVGRVEASLHANGIKPAMFLDGLKKTLTGRKVRTNTFGRMILMAGLLSVSWHMHQRDLQISSIGVSHGMGVPDGWKEPLTKAFDFWKRDYDESMAHMRRAVLPWQSLEVGVDESEPSKMAAVLHHLTHMAMHIDIMDCQIFAGAKHLFGRAIKDADYERVKVKMHGWVKTPGCRMAVYHALQVIKDILSPSQDGALPNYSSRDDHIFFRPWVAYFSALIIWSWGFATDGLLRPFPSHLIDSSSPAGMSTPASNYNHPRPYDRVSDASLRDAQSFLRTIGTVKSPQELETIKTGRNNLVGLLQSLEFAFVDSRWELLHEAAHRLRNAVKLLEK